MIQFLFSFSEQRAHVVCNGVCIHGGLEGGGGSFRVKGTLNVTLLPPATLMQALSHGFMVGPPMDPIIVLTIVAWCL